MLQKYWSVKKKKGFTLVELMVVVAIIAILIAIAIPIYHTMTENAQKAACQANQRTIDFAILEAFVATDRWVTNSNIADLAKSSNFGGTTIAGPFLKEKDLTCPSAEGKAYTVNEDTHEAICSNEQHKREDVAAT